MIEFPYEDVERFISIHTPCDCAKTFDIQDKQLVRIEYVPNVVPPHIKAEGRDYYSTEKIFTIVYVPKSAPSVQATAIIMFKAKVKD